MGTLLWILLLAFPGQADGFLPRQGDAATYRMTTPLGESQLRTVIEGFDEPTQTYLIGAYQQTSSKEVKKTEKRAASKVLETYIADIRNYCQTRGGQLTTAELKGASIEACRTVIDKGALKQEFLWAAHVPFGLLWFLKSSPLSPKAKTELWLLDYARSSAE